MVCFECFGLCIRFHWLSAVTAVLLFLAFSSLGIWQFGKAKAKIEALEQSEVLASQEPVNLRELSPSGGWSLIGSRCKVRVCSLMAIT